MLPLFDNERKRKINLGGVSSASSRSAILDQVQAQRIERDELKKKQDNAMKIQAWWRGLQQEMMMRNKMRKSFENDVVGITGLRCLALIGRRDEAALAMWSNTMVELGAGMSDILDGDCFKGCADSDVVAGALFGLALSGDPQLQNSWLILIKQVCFLLLLSVSKSPL